MCAHSRRDFLARSAAATALALGTNKWLAAAPQVAPEKTDMAIAKWAGSKELSADEIQQTALKLTEKAIEGLGGMKRFVKTGDVVWVKPNIGWDRTPELAGNTNPQVVAAVVKMCFDAGAKTVKVGDNPVHAAAKTYVSSGIAAAVKPLGAEVVFLGQEPLQADRHWRRTGQEPLAVSGHHRLRPGDQHPRRQAPRALQRDNRHEELHGRDGQSPPFHQDFAVCLSDLTRFMKPRLCVLDAIRVLKDHGPVGGRPEDVVVKTTVAAGVNIVALDALGLELLGKDPGEVKKAKAILKYAEETGLGKVNYRSIALREIALS